MLIKNFKVLMDGLLLLGGNFIFKIMAVFVFSDGICSCFFFPAHQWNLQFQIITFKGSNGVVLAPGKNHVFFVSSLPWVGKEFKTPWVGLLVWMYFLG